MSDKFRLFTSVENELSFFLPSALSIVHFVCFPRIIVKTLRTRELQHDAILNTSTRSDNKLSKLYLRYKRKMVGSNGTMIAIRLVRSKLRKREDHSNAVHPEPTVVQTATSPISTIVASSYSVEGCCTQISTTTTSTDLGNNTAVEQDNVYVTTNATEQFVWQFPPPYPPPHTPAQYALCNGQVGRNCFSCFSSLYFSFVSFSPTPGPPIFRSFFLCAARTCDLEGNRRLVRIAFLSAPLVPAALTSRASITRFHWFIPLPDRISPGS